MSLCVDQKLVSVKYILKMYIVLLWLWLEVVILLSSEIRSNIVNKTRPDNKIHFRPSSKLTTHTASPNQNPYSKPSPNPVQLVSKPVHLVPPQTHTATH